MRCPSCLQENVKAGFRGWEARVTGVDSATHSDGPHVFVEFPGWAQQYHFPASLVRTWVVGGAHKKRAQQQHGSEEEGGEAAPPPHKSPRKATASSSRTPAASSRRRAAAAAQAAARDQLTQPPATSEEDNSQDEEPGPAHTPGDVPSPAKSAIMLRSTHQGAATGVRADAAAVEPAGQREHEQQRGLAEAETDEALEEEEDKQAAHPAVAGEPSEHAAAAASSACVYVSRQPYVASS